MTAFDRQIAAIFGTGWGDDDSQPVPTPRDMPQRRIDPDTLPVRLAYTTTTRP